jgi:low affinity Fe/Cu permease
MTTQERSRRKEDHSLSRRLERLAGRVTEFSGGSWGFSLALLIVVVWALSGPMFHFSETWQLVINTGTTIVTFLMVFLIQRSQNKDSRALHIKLNELVAAMEGASNRLIDVESLSEDDLKALTAHYAKLSERAEEEQDVTSSHSIEEAEARHTRKSKRRLSDAAKKA